MKACHPTRSRSRCPITSPSRRRELATCWQNGRRSTVRKTSLVWKKILSLGSSRLIFKCNVHPIVPTLYWVPIIVWALVMISFSWKFWTHPTLEAVKWHEWARTHYAALLSFLFSDYELVWTLLAKVEKKPAKDWKCKCKFWCCKSFLLLRISAW